MKRPGSAADPLWYKDAIVYELHVKAFHDSNQDGIGDFQGLIQKLDYLQDLGITCIWLLPFFPSPLRDDGYDIADYLDVNPSYGTMEDFRNFLDAAHERDLQVMIELVINHTSDQHPWFQAARLAPPGSPERNFYVWSDTDEKYKDARIIFTDTEKSNWTWDPVAKAYYWHRFFSHQPDLNYDNPAVVEEVLKIMRYWLDLGVDALRVDAVPYLVERDGTNCENLPETHAIIKKLRREIDDHYSSRMMLAEANQWPSDVRPYFGDADEFHMAFHFPLMPRIYMALRQEDRLPITDIMAQTPPIPESCQWGLFLRNHDELTLEMVTRDERDYMYFAYSADPRSRINIGIRRRLAPLVDNNHRRIELLNSLLFSFPGTPIIYYGDEIGMGDNIYLGDRNGVRTPMQWSADRNAGFSRATPGKLYSPVIMDPVWGYEAVNVEAQQSDPSSLLNWMRNMIALRKLFRVFGRGTLEFLNPTNRKVLAYVRQFDGERILCVANLSRFAQPVELDLSGFQGKVPVEMLGYVQFPPIGKEPYRLTLGAYGFMWLELHDPPESSDLALEGQPELAVEVTNGWRGLLDEAERQRFEDLVLPEYFSKQRWFARKSQRIQTTRVVDWTELGIDSSAALLFVSAHYEDGQAETYLLPLAMTFGPSADEIRETVPSAVLCSILSETETDTGLLYDAAFDQNACAELLQVIADSQQIPTPLGMVRGVAGSAFASLRGSKDLPVVRCAPEDMNSCLRFGDSLMLKLYRYLETGPNPAFEITRYLTERTEFHHIQPFAGVIEYVREGAEPATIALLQGVPENEGDNWHWTLEELERYYESNAPAQFPSEAIAITRQHIIDLSESFPSQFARDHIGLYLDAATTLGRRTAELHLALAAATDDPALVPEPLVRSDIDRLLTGLREHATNVFDSLRVSLPTLPDDVVERGALVLSRRRQILDHFKFGAVGEIKAMRTRIHGDYNLNNVRRVKTDYLISNFEGDPTQSLAERREKHSPLKDVASMLRSFSYAAYAALIRYTARRPEDLERLEPWAGLWERAVGAEFLRAYREAAQTGPFLPAERTVFRDLLMTYLLDKAFKELHYEIRNRPAWTRIPLEGILSLSV